MHFFKNWNAYFIGWNEGHSFAVQNTAEFNCNIYINIYRFKVSG